jgi:hypothetical protein
VVQPYQPIQKVEENLAHLPSAFGFGIEFIGSTGGPRVSPLTKLVVVVDRRRLAAQCRELAALPGLIRLIPGHGGNVNEQPASVLLDVAARI